MAGHRVMWWRVRRLADGVEWCGWPLPRLSSLLSPPPGFFTLALELIPRAEAALLDWWRQQPLMRLTPEQAGGSSIGMQGSGGIIRLLREPAEDDSNTARVSHKAQISLTPRTTQELFVYISKHCRGAMGAKVKSWDDHIWVAGRRWRGAVETGHCSV
ncbi:hypothetical protein Vretifemale_10116 [Volvox reticuliferus]|uniref:Uncharacterized protein n=1 Tax=Volvox reticuliferus TaxID=1737510 RepID=A0A8J4CFW1_9CHLO|nr:hypothetical protein Vretifemale_10116 [Volvox reticuliferus]